MRSGCSSSFTVPVHWCYCLRRCRFCCCCSVEILLMVANSIHFGLFGVRYVTSNHHRLQNRSTRFRHISPNQMKKHKPTLSSILFWQKLRHKYLCRRSLTHSNTSECVNWSRANAESRNENKNKSERIEANGFFIEAKHKFPSFVFLYSARANKQNSLCRLDWLVRVLPRLQSKKNRGKNETKRKTAESWIDS